MAAMAALEAGAAMAGPVVEAVPADRAAPAVPAAAVPVERSSSLPVFWQPARLTDRLVLEMVPARLVVAEG